MLRYRFYIGIHILTVLLVILAFYGSERRESTPTIIVSEVCTENRTTAYDENGNYGATFIELYNLTDREINIGGYGISDSHSDFYMSVLPDVGIPAHSGLVLWNDQAGQDLSAYDEDYQVLDIHDVEVKISPTGDNLYLTDADGNTIFQMAVPGDIPDGLTYQTTLENTNRYVCGEPTLYYVAATADSITQVEAEGTLSTPSFSVDGGWYEESFDLELTCESGDIYYTLDGSEPDESSAKYDGPITIANRSKEPNIYSAIGNISVNNPYLPEDPVDKCTVVKAVAIAEGNRSDVAVRSYFVGLNDDEAYKDVAVISLTVDPEDLFDYDDGIYTTGRVYDRREDKYGEANIYIGANYAAEGYGWERPAQIEYYSANHEELLRQEIGIRIHGGNSVAHNQKSLNLYARTQYDGNEFFQYAFFGKSYHKLMLRSGGYNDVYVTKMRDALNQRLVNNREIGWLETEPCVLFLNGEYWGLYNLQEVPGKDYVAANYGLDREEVVVLKNPWENGGSSGNSEMYTGIVDYAEWNDLSVQENYDWVADRIDLQSYIEYFAAEIYYACCDTISNNYAVWRSSKIIDDGYGDGRWRFLMYDTDDSDAMVTELTSADVDSFVGGHWTTPPIGEDGDVLFSALIENETFKEQFVTTFMDMANEDFDYERVHELLYEMADEYCAADVASQHRFRGDAEVNDYEEGLPYTGWYTEENFWADVAVIDAFFRDRKQYITRYMGTDLGLAGELAEVRVCASEDGAAEIGINTLTVEGSTSGWQGEYYTDYPVRLSCVPADGYTFLCWKVNGSVVSDEAGLELEIGGDTEIEAVVQRIGQE